ncbi:MAG: methionine--tRNA ligase [Cardiobacteriaceae bacterium]|nr:methionine--tRNA ligase [Cardiobacteriaceae bacterium]
MSKRRIFVTSALPYANGAIHLGHMVEYIQTDIWVRFQQMRGNECHYVCADDSHGTPIMIRAEKEGITPQELIDKTKKEHQRDFQGFLVNHHKYHSTHSAENKELTSDIYLKLKSSGFIKEETISQSFDPEKQMFLPDRFVKGECPKCHAKDQYGDNCENCGTTYSPTDLINPYSVLTGATPIKKESLHYFFDLPKFETELKNWLKSANIQDTMRNKLQEWFIAGLQAWDISRDAPYWGFEIPEAENKYFYVWLDAPIGYFAAFKNLCVERNIDFEEFIKPDTQTELYHFIGKDIAYFHMLFWPAVLKGANIRQPTGVFCHGFLTVNGEKMSKSRGTFIKAETYLKHLRPEYLRYYFASKLSAKVEDIDLNLEDFRQKVNSDLVGKLVNLASRCAPFLTRLAGNKLSSELSDRSLFDLFAEKSEIIADYYEKREYSFAIKEIMNLADKANEYIDAEKPWVLAKEENKAEEVQKIATIGLNAFRQLIIYLKPILPQIAKDSEEYLKCGELSWEDVKKPFIDKELGIFKALLQRVEEKQIAAIISDSKEDLSKENNIGKKTDKKKTADSVENNTPSEIAIDDFAKLDIRIAEVLECEKVEGSDKLLKFKLNVGELGEKQVFSGIAKYHQPEELLGKLVVYLANLKPRKMRFGISEGMILSASNEENLQVLLASGRAKAGMRIS